MKRLSSPSDFVGDPPMDSRLEHAGMTCVFGQPHDNPSIFHHSCEGDNMIEYLGTIVPLALGILLSPEILVGALLITAWKPRSMSKAWLFCLSGMVGIIIPVLLGFFLTSTKPGGPSMTGFILKSTFGIILILLAFRLIFKGRLVHKKLLPDLSGKKGTVIAIGFGLLLTLFNVKVISLAFAAGNEISNANVPTATHLIALLIFFVLSAVPLMLPAFLETVFPGIVQNMMEPCNRILEKYGKWIVVIICLVAGAILIKNGLALKPPDFHLW